MAMRILPVIDLMGGVVVRGVAGQRAEYRPVQTCLADGADPVAIGRAFRERLQLSEAYVADLDAIAGAEPAWDDYRRLIACGLSLLVDAGLATIERARRLAEFRVEGQPLAAIIAGLESVPGPEAIGRMLEIIGPQRFVFSLDLKAGSPLVAAPEWQGLSAETIAQETLRMGVRRLIVLDLARVGTFQGIGVESLIRRLREFDGDVELISGGGVRSADDLRVLAVAGCDAALIASALHDGRLGPAELETFKARD